MNKSKQLSLKQLYLVININLSKHAPIKEKCMKKGYQSGWFDKELKCAIWKRDLLKKTFNFIQDSQKLYKFPHKEKETYFNKAIKNKRHWH